MATDNPECWHRTRGDEGTKWTFPFVHLRAVDNNLRELHRDWEAMYFKCHALERAVRQAFKDARRGSGGWTCRGHTLSV